MVAYGQFTNFNEELVENLGRPQAPLTGLMWSPGAFLTPEEKRFAAALAQDGRLSKVLKYLDQHYALAGGIRLDTDKCAIKAVTAFSNHYRPDSRSIEVCLSNIVDFRNMLERHHASDANDIAQNALLFVTLHEFGHALIHDYKVVVLGREEDAADEIATILLIRNGMPNAIEGAASFFELLPVGGGPSDPHVDAGRRAYRIRCLERGSLGEEYDGSVAQGVSSCMVLFRDQTSQFDAAMADAINRRSQRASRSDGRSVGP